MPDVEIYLAQAGGESPVPFKLLSIPENDVRRLAIRPLKWLRFVTFCVCGARGDLFESPTSPVVNYDSTSLSASYYYRPNEVLAFIDPNGLNGRATSTARSERGLSFMGRIIERDGENCVVTGKRKNVCEAVHIVPLKKGDEYLALVIRDRSHCYDETTVENFGINAAQNGIFLNMNLHRQFAGAEVAFLKMPNFALNADDIQFEPGDSISADCIILHRLKDVPIERSLVSFLAPGVALSEPHAQVMFEGTGHLQPPAVILDFMYGVAAYKRWKSLPSHTDIEKYREHYASVLSNPNDGDHEPDYESSCDAEGPCDRENTLVDAMDDLNFVLMYLSGISPEEAAMRKIKRLEEEERLAQEASRHKVTEWVKTLAPSSS